MAHPVRLALLEAMGRDGQITATEAAELLGESPGNMSWHLQTLAKYGFVEETGDGRGRRRPWRVTHDSHRMDTSDADPETAAAGETLERLFFDRNVARIREWWARRRDYPVKWRRAAFMNGTLAYLTDEELSAISDEIVAIYERFAGRDDKAARPDGAEPVQLIAFGNPLPPTAEGN